MRSIKVNKKQFKFTSSLKNIIGNYHIATPEDTIKEIVKKRVSIARFGDGEFDFIFGTDMKYQSMNEKLAERLKEVLESNIENLLIGIPNVFNIEYANKYVSMAKTFWLGWIKCNKFKILKLLKKNKNYFSAPISRFYLDYLDKSHTKDYINKLKEMWDKEDIIIIEGEKSRLGVGNDLFENTKSIQRIICPPENAFNKYEEILEEAKKLPKDKKIFLALGPTATVLAYDLTKIGFQAIDIGHVDIEYEWFLKGATEKIRLENKYVTEVVNGETNISDINDKNYKEQIVVNIK